MGTPTDQTTDHAPYCNYLRSGTQANNLKLGLAPRRADPQDWDCIGSAGMGKSRGVNKTAS
jgi:hypothetical protein